MYVCIPLPLNLRGPGALYVVADPDWLVDMLLNLVGNAAKFTSSGHVAVKCFARAGDAPGLGSRPITQLACPRAAWEVVSLPVE